VTRQPSVVDSQVDSRLIVEDRVRDSLGGRVATGVAEHGGELEQVSVANTDSRDFQRA
jgi:hypothetical protein